MMSRHFAVSSELTGAIAKRLPHAKNQPSTVCFIIIGTRLLLNVVSNL